MADIHWLNPVSGNFNTGTNWSGGAVPGSMDNAILGVLGGTPYTVTESPRNFEQVSTLQVATNATFVIGYYDNFQVLPQSGSSIGTNAGTIQSTGGHSDLVLGQGTFTNTGTIELSNGQLLVQAATATTLDGGGQVILNGGFGSSIGQVVGALDNIDNTIAGGGFISAPITNEAAGIINANGVGSALFISDHPITNNGLIESTGVGANLFLDIRRGASVDQTGGGTILAANGAVVYLEQVTISGGTLTTVGTGVIDIGFSNTVLDGSGAVLADKATINVLAGYTTGQYEATLKGAIANSGVINVAGARSTGNQTNLIIDAAGVTLTGAGSINLVAGVATRAGAGTAEIVGVTGGATLTNVDNTISGTGGIGADYLSVINGAKGVIDANQATDLNLVGTVTNAGLIEATVGALVAAGTISNAGGTIEANGGRVLLHGVDIAGGTVESVGASAIVTYGSGSVLDGTTQAVTLSGAVTVLGGVNLAVEGAIDNGGRVNLASSTASPGNTDLIVGAAGATLSGGGQIVLTPLATNLIHGVAGTPTLTNVDNRISGAGLIGGGALTLVNGAKGVIVANSAVALTLNTGANAIVNAGVIYATPKGLMIIDSAVNNSGVLAVQGGLLKVNGAVSGAGRAVITGGLLDFTSSFSQNAQFGAAGTLELAQSHLYGGTLIGFSKTGGNSLDLADIAGGTASYSGDARRGVLTVTGGGVTAHFQMVGDYTGSVFTTRSDGHGGTIVTDPAKPSSASVAPPHALIAAMASLGTGAGALRHAIAEPWGAPAAMLTGPRVSMA